MATIRYDKSQLKFYVERAGADPSGNRLFEADPLELVVYVDTDGSMDNDVVKVSGTCRGATRGAPGTGSIIGYHIGGLHATEDVTWGKLNDVSGVVLPIDRILGSEGSRKSNIQNNAYLTAGVDSTHPSVGTATIKIVTTKNPIQVSIPEPPDVNYPLGFRRGEVSPKERKTGVLSNYQFDAGTILFDDFVFYGDYSDLTYLSLSLETTKELWEVADYPFQIDLYDLVSDNHGKNLNIKILRVTENTPSLLQTDLTDAVDENGILTYAPQGNFLRNQLIIESEISEEFPEVTIQARQTARSESNPYSTTPDGTRRLLPITSEKQPKMKTTLEADVSDNIIGDPDKSGQFWSFQGNNGTCMLAAIGSILESQGVASFDELLATATIGMDRNGHYVILDGVGNPVLDEMGNYVHANFNDPNGNPLVELFVDGVPMYIRILEPLSSEFTDTLTPDQRLRLFHTQTHIRDYPATFPNFFPNQNWGWVKQVFDHFGVESHTGYASDFTTLIAELQAGNGVIAYVDGKELWDSRIMTEAVDSGWEPLNGSRTRENHAVWITGVDVTDPENPQIIINDSGQTGGYSRSYPLKEFLASFEDSEFLFQATSAASPDPNVPGRTALLNTMRRVVARAEGGQAAERLSFNKSINDPNFVDWIDRSLGGAGFKNAVARYKQNVENYRTQILEQWGLDPEEIDKVFDEVDVE